jgi:hypothetical protein
MAIIIHQQPIPCSKVPAMKISQDEWHVLQMKPETVLRIARLGSGIQLLIALLIECFKSQILLESIPDARTSCHSSIMTHHFRPGADIPLRIS